MTVLDIADVRVGGHGSEWRRAYTAAVENARYTFPDLPLTTLFTFQEPDPDRALLSTVLISVTGYEYDTPPHLQEALSVRLAPEMQFLFVAVTGRRRSTRAALRHLTTSLTANGFTRIPRRAVVEARTPDDLSKALFEAIRDIALHLPSLATTMSQVERAAIAAAGMDNDLLTPKGLP